MKSLNRREFVKAAVAGSLCAFPALQGLSAPAGGVPQTRLDRLSKGANVCRWFRFTREDPERLANYISDDEAAMMRRMGLTHVRLCIQPRIVMDQTTGALREDNCALVDAALERFHRAGLLVLIDIHNEDRQVEVDPAWQDAFARFWGEFAARLKRLDPELTVLEIVNEPVFDGRESEWDTLNARLASVIRKNAPEHTIMTSGPNWGGIDGLKKLKLLEDPNAVYSFHCYDPFPFTHQGATWSSESVKPLREVPYPSSPEAVASVVATLEPYPQSRQMIEKYGRERWDKARLAARFKEGIAWGAQHRVPLYCGEFGVFPRYAQAVHRANWFRDFGQVLAENQIGWGVWGWDEGFGLNRRYVDGKPVVDKTVAEALGLTGA